MNSHFYKKKLLRQDVKIDGDVKNVVIIMNQDGQMTGNLHDALKVVFEMFLQTNEGGDAYKKFIDLCRAVCFAKAKELCEGKKEEQAKLLGVSTVHVYQTERKLRRLLE